jgi:hypothetical protein
VPTLNIKAAGRGTYCRTKVNKHGMFRGSCMHAKLVHGFHSGDMVRADVPTGRQAGVRVGRVAVSASGSFNRRREGASFKASITNISKFFSVPTGMATPCRLRRFATASRPHSFPASRRGYPA